MVLYGVFMTYRVGVGLISLLCISTIAQGMEIKNWDYKERDKGYISYLLPKQENPTKYPYFLPEKDESESKRSFSNELLFAKTVEKNWELPKDITKQILNYAYLTEKTLDVNAMRALEEFCKFNKFNFLYLPLKSKRALAYIFENAKANSDFIIEGRDKEFACKMSQDILDLPLVIKKRLIYDSGRNYMLCNSKYKPSMYNTLMGEDDAACNANRDRLARVAKVTTAGALTLGGLGVLANTDLQEDTKVFVSGATAGAVFSTAYATIKQVYDPRIPLEIDTVINCIGGASGIVTFPIMSSIKNIRVGQNIKKDVEPAVISGVGCAIGTLVAEGVGLYVSDKIEKLLQENQEERELRLGFEKIPLLKDDEK